MLYSREKQKKKLKKYTTRDRTQVGFYTAIEKKIVMIIIYNNINNILYHKRRVYVGTVRRRNHGASIREKTVYKI